MKTVNTDETIMLAKALYDQLSDRSKRDLHSIEYKQGLWQSLLFSALSEPVKNPYNRGTSSYDAFVYGLSAGEKVWIENRQECKA